MIVCFIFICGCGPSQKVKDMIRDEHAQLYVYVKKFKDPDQMKRPTQDQNERLIKANLKNSESRDKEFNGWVPSSTMEEFQDGK